jgi:hypothetical protein|tara:strand:+ start:305 stop:709 length:405 start_codon:yes stop_codon:yes gene_type:complete
MKRKKKVSINYIAGLFDGEGCITTSQIMKYNPMMKKRYLCTTIRAEISNTDFGLIDDCYKFFGKIGHICNIKPRITAIGNKTKPQKRWQLTHRQVEKVLKKLLPYLRNKDKIKKGTWVLRHYKKGITNGAKNWV